MPEWVDELIQGIEEAGKAYAQKRAADKAKRAQDLQAKQELALLEKQNATQAPFGQYGGYGVPQGTSNYLPIAIVAGIGAVALIAMRGK